MAVRARSAAPLQDTILDLKPPEPDKEVLLHVRWMGRAGGALQSTKHAFFCKFYLLVAFVQLILSLVPHFITLTDLEMKDTFF